MHEIPQQTAQPQRLVIAGQQGMGEVVQLRSPRPLRGQPDRAAVIILRMNTIAPSTVPASFPDAAASFMLDGPVGKLETTSDAAEPASARRGVAVICHPLTTEGGTMHNKVVTMVERALRESGLDTVRFNFRQAGQSQGDYDKGDGEREDLAAVVA